MSQSNETPQSSREDAADQLTDPTAGKDEILKQRLRPDELAADAGSWLWRGYLGSGKITLLTSQWKSGKTTLVSILLARMGNGGELAGLPVAAGRAAVMSEESPDNWAVRCRKLQMGDHLSLFCRPFRTKPTMAQWLGFLEAMIELRLREGLDLVVIDPLAVFLPGNSENSAEAIMKCLLPLRDLTARGLAVLLVHHPRKGSNLAGQAARGSGALASHVDVLVEMNWCGKPDDAGDRRRWLRAYSRHEETRRHLILELTDDGTDYRVHDTPPDESGAECWQVLHLVLEDAGERLTQREILDQWPEGFRKADLGTVSRLLNRGVEQGMIRRSGSGRRNDRYRYWLPDKEEDFHPGPNASADELERWQQHWESKCLQSLGSNGGAHEKAIEGVES